MFGLLSVGLAFVSVEAGWFAFIALLAATLSAASLLVAGNLTTSVGFGILSLFGLAILYLLK